MDYLLHHRVKVWLQMAAANLRESLTRNLQVDEKTSARDLVTEMDKATEAFLIDKIRSHYPDHRIIGEEGQGDTVTDTQGTIWVIDPIDGTLNFVKEKNYFGIMVGIYHDGQAQAGYIYDVMRGDLYYGIVGDGVYLNDLPLKTSTFSSLSECLIVGNTSAFIENFHNAQALAKTSLGVRSYGASALEIIAVLRGEVGLYISRFLQPWDFSAGKAIFETLGYPTSTIEGQPLNILTGSNAVFGHPAVYSEAMEIIAQSQN